MAYYLDSDSDSFQMDPVYAEHKRNRARSRRRSPDYLAPPEAVFIGGDLHRSRSTGARPRRDRDPRVVIDINNEIREMRNNSRRSQSQARRHRIPVDDEYDDDDWGEIEPTPVHRPRRSRAHSHAPPEPPHFSLDPEMHLQVDRMRRVEAEEEKRRQIEMLRINDRIRQLDMEADRNDLKQQLELEEMKRYRDEEDTRKEIERANYMHKLKQFEKEKREEAERREIECAENAKKLKKRQEEEAAREEFEQKLKLEKAREVEEKEAKKKQEEKIKQQILLEQAEKEAEEAERKKRERKLRKEAIEEYTREQAEKKIKEEQEKAEADRAFEERVKKEFGAAGFSESYIDNILKRDGQVCVEERIRCESPSRHQIAARPIPAIRVSSPSIFPSVVCFSFF